MVRYSGGQSLKPTCLDGIYLQLGARRTWKRDKINKNNNFIVIIVKYFRRLCFHGSIIFVFDTLMLRDDQTGGNWVVEKRIYFLDPHRVGYFFLLLPTCQSDEFPISSGLADATTFHIARL